MDLNQFVENFADQFDETDVNDIKAETIFKDLKEWSSLMALSIIAMVDEEYDVKVKGDDIRNAHTVNDLYEIVKSRL
ncbi:acyl carrier protein [Phocaeicola sp.]